MLVKLDHETPTVAKNSLKKNYLKPPPSDSLMIHQKGTAAQVPMDGNGWKWLNLSQEMSLTFLVMNTPRMGYDAEKTEVDTTCIYTSLTKHQLFPKPS